METKGCTAAAARAGMSSAVCISRGAEAAGAQESKVLLDGVWTQQFQDQQVLVFSKPALHASRQSVYRQYRVSTRTEREQYRSKPCIDGFSTQVSAESVCTMWC
jgi:hypothetical protein